MAGSKAMLSNILDTVPQSVFWKDTEGRYLGCNTVFALAAGLDAPAQIIGKTDFELPWPREEAEAYRADDREVLQHNQPKLHIIEQLQLADGKRLWVDTSKVPLTAENGRTIGVLGVFEDITDRKRTEEALRESQDKHLQLLKHLHAGVVVHDSDTHILFANDEATRLLGLTIDQMMGKTTVDPAWCFVKDDETPMSIDDYPVSLVIATRSSINDLVLGVNRPCTNGFVWVLINAFPQFESDGQLSQVVVTFVDITSLKLAEKALQKAKEQAEASN